VASSLSPACPPPAPPCCPPSGSGNLVVPSQSFSAPVLPAAPGGIIYK
jgi:hypothetical protein